MVQAIVPMVHGERSSFRQAALLHVLGAAIAGAATGLVVGGIGWVVAEAGVVAEVRVGVVATLGAIAAVRELLAPRMLIPIPGRRRQVPRSWGEQMGQRSSAFVYGVGLGAGFATHVWSAAYWVAAAAAIASGSPLAGAAIGASYGSARALATIALTRTLRSWGDAHRVHRRLLSAEPGMRLATAAVLTLGALSSIIWL